MSSQPSAYFIYYSCACVPFRFGGNLMIIPLRFCSVARSGDQAHFRQASCRNRLPLLFICGNPVEPTRERGTFVSFLFFLLSFFFFLFHFSFGRAVCNNCVPRFALLLNLSWTFVLVRLFLCSDCFRIRGLRRWGITLRAPRKRWEGLEGLARMR